MPRLVGVYGGSFDPVHDGHLTPVEEMRRAFALDEVLFVPAHLAPHKPKGASASSHHRFAMLALALEDYPELRLCDFEVERETTSYTFETLRHLRQRYPGAELMLVVGSDSFVAIETWKEAGEILETTRVVVMGREPWDYDRSRGAVSAALASRMAPPGATPGDSGGFTVLWSRNQPVTISSTWIRKALADGKQPPESLPPRVARYLQRHGLYASPRETPPPPSPDRSTT